MLEGFVTEMPIPGWVLLYLVIGWVLVVADIVSHFVEEEGEIAVRIVAWPLILLGKLLRQLFGLIAKGMRATERLGSKIREFDNEMRKGP